MKKVFLFANVLFFTTSFILLKGQTKDELKAEREQLKMERKSEAFQKRHEKLAELKEPGTTDINSIDELASTSTVSLASVVQVNEMLPDLYKRTIGEDMDGITDVTVKKPSLDEECKILS